MLINIVINFDRFNVSGKKAAKKLVLDQTKKYLYILNRWFNNYMSVVWPLLSKQTDFGDCSWYVVTSVWSGATSVAQTQKEKGKINPNLQKEEK